MPDPAQRAQSGHMHHSHTAGDGTTPAMHPERAAVAAHLHHMHNRVTSPGMASHPLTPSEGHMLREGAEAVTRAANSVA